MKIWRIFCLACSFCLIAAFSAQSSEFHAWQAGPVKIVRIADKTGGAPAKVFQGEKDIIERYTSGHECPNQTAAFLLITPEDTVLIDSGWGKAGSGRLAGILQKAGFAPESISKVAITHLHPDHVGGMTMDGKKAFPNARVYVDKTEHDFWTKKITADTGDFNKPARDFLALYRDDMILFNPADGILPWLATGSAPGHTPGQVYYTIRDGKKNWHVGGDIFHCLPMQAAHPEISVIWDEDQDLARKTRIDFQNKAADNGDFVLGGHFGEPGAAVFTRNGQNGFDYRMIAPQK